MACHMNAQGELICPNTVAALMEESTWTNVNGALDALIPPPGQKKRDLIRKLIEAVHASQLSDTCVGSRTNDAVQSIVTVLAQDPPVLMAYRYVPLPGDVLASFYMARGRMVEAAKATARWSTLDPQCL